MKKVSEMFDLMPDILEGAIIINVYGNEHALVENYQSIIEYSENQIKLQGKHVKLLIAGENLLIDRFTEDDCKIFGKIEEVRYIPM